MRSIKFFVVAVMAIVLTAIATILIVAHGRRPAPVAGPVPHLSIPPTSGNNALPRPKEVTNEPLDDETTTRVIKPKVVDSDPAPVLSLVSDRPFSPSVQREEESNKPAKAKAAGGDNDLPVIDADNPQKSNKPAPKLAPAPGLSPTPDLGPAPNLGPGPGPNNAGNTAPGKKPALAVIPFKLWGPVPDAEKDAGVILAEQLLGVTSSKTYALYERTQITELLKEKTFEESDLADKPGAAVKFGRMSGISFLVIGTLSRLDGQYYLTARVVDCQSGQVGQRGRISDKTVSGIGQRIGELTTMLGLSDPDAPPPPRQPGNDPARPAPPDVPTPTPTPPAPAPVHPTPPPVAPPQPAPNPLDPPHPAPVEPPHPPVQPPRGGPRPPLTIADLIEVVNPNPAFHANVIPTAGHRDYVQDENISFTLKTDRDCFLTILTVDSAGAITTLLPNKDLRELHMTAGQDVLFPPKDSFTLPIQAPYGKTLVKLLATVRPLKLDDLTEQRLADQSFVQLRADSRAIGFKAAPDRAPVQNPASLDEMFGADGWVDAALIVNTIPKGGTPPPPQPGIAGDPNEAVFVKFREVCATLGMQVTSADAMPSPRAELGSVKDLLVIRKPANDGQRGIGGVAQSKDYRLLLGETEVVPAQPIGAKAVGADNISDQMKRLKTQPGVVAVIPNFTVSALAESDVKFLPVEYALHNQFSVGRDIGWDRVADRASRIVPPLIGLVDQGMNIDDPRVLPIAWTNAGEIPDNGKDDDNNGAIDDIHGFNFVLKSNQLFDPLTHMNHGTFCSVIMGGRMTGSPIDVQGIAPRATIIPAVCLAPPADNINGGATGNVEQIRAAVSYVMANGAKVINMSLGSHMSRENLAAVNKDPIWDELEQKGIIVVCAAGNDASDNDADPFFPANLGRSNMVSVMATDAAGKLGRGKRPDGWKVFTNYGRTTVHLAAPGSVILSVPTNGAIGLNNGTSFSAPMVAASMALVWGQHPEWDYKTVIRAVLETVTPMDDLKDKCITGGMLNLPAALDWQPR
jgi:subtilisin family serine protease